MSPPKKAWVISPFVGFTKWLTFELTGPQMSETWETDVPEAAPK